MDKNYDLGKLLINLSTILINFSLPLVSKLTSKNTSKLIKSSKNFKLSQFIFHKKKSIESIWIYRVCKIIEDKHNHTFIYYTKPLFITAKEYLSYSHVHYTHSTTHRTESGVSEKETARIEKETFHTQKFPILHSLSLFGGSKKLEKHFQYKNIFFLHFFASFWL